MSEKVVEELSQSRWAIGMVAIAIYALWTFQRGKTRRLALMCAIVDHAENLPAVEAFLEKSTIGKRRSLTRKVFPDRIVTIIDAFRTLPENTLMPARGHSAKLDGSRNPAESAGGAESACSELEEVAGRQVDAISPPAFPKVSPCPLS